MSGSGAAGGSSPGAAPPGAPASDGMRRYLRFNAPGGTTPAHGLAEGDRVLALDGDPLAGPVRPTGGEHRLAEVSLLVPCQPSKILAVGRNYRSHLGTRPAPTQPELFWKPISALQIPEGPILLPPEATNVHFEGELVLVVGRRLKRASPEEARAGIFGVTCGNDVSEREWQAGPHKDLQWWRAKGSDTFAPCGPVIAAGLPCDDLPLTTRLNGQVVQQQSTADLLFDAATVLAYASRFVTLEPGDLVYTGTPGNTSKLAPGDVVEVEIEGIGVLRNPVAAGLT